MAEGWLLGIEIGGTKLQLGLGRRDAGLCVLERRSVEPSDGAAAILDADQADVPIPARKELAVAL